MGAPQSQQDRLHPNEGTQKGQKSCLRVSKIDSTEESALQEINWYLEVNKIGFTKTRTEIKLVPQGHRNRPHRRKRTAKLNWYLEVNKIDFTKRGQNEKLVPLGQRNRPNRRKRTVKNKIASRSPKSTSPTKAPTKGSRQNAIRRA